MLYGQTSDAVRRQLVHELKIKTRYLEYGITQSPSPLETRYAKLDVVCAYIDRTHDVGTVEDPRFYFRGHLPMKFGRYPTSVHGPLSVAYFSGQTDDKIVALGGTAHHIIGSVGDRPWTNSGVADLMMALSLESQGSTDPIDRRLPGFWPSEAREVLDKHPGVEQQLEFLAMKHEETDDGFGMVLLGTPIYVASAADGATETAPQKRRWWSKT